MNIIPADQRSAPPAPPKRPFSIYVPAIAVGVALLLYTAYWFFMAGKVRDAAENFAASSQDISAQWDELSMGGFPYRIEAGFQKPRIEAPHTPEAWAWSADGMSVGFMPYNLKHLVLKVDGEQQLLYRKPSEGGRQHSIKMQAEGSFASYVALDDAPLGRLAIDIQNAKGQLDAQENYAATRLQLHLRPVPIEGEPVAGAPPAPSRDYDLALQGENILLDPARASPALGANISLFIAQTRAKKLPVTGKASLVELLQSWRAAGGELAISDLTLKWGALDMTGRGILHLDETGRMAGRIDAVFSNYEQLLKSLVAADIITDAQARIATAGLSLFSQFQGSQDGAVKLPLVMRNGTLFLGPLPIGALEPLY